MNVEKKSIPTEKIFKASEMPCEMRHPLIMRLWEMTAVSDYFVIENDHDPVPLQMQFNRLYKDSFSWDYLERGPEVFRIKVTRLRAG